MTISFNTGNKGYTDISVNSGLYSNLLNAVGALLNSRGISNDAKTTLCVNSPDKHTFRFDYKYVDTSDNKTVYVFRNTEAEDYYTSDNGVIRHNELKIKDTGSTFYSYGVLGTNLSQSYDPPTYTNISMFKEDSPYDSEAPLKATLYW